MDLNFVNPFLLNQLETIDAEELMATPYAPKKFVVSDMLPEGLILLCGPSKIGKSWFVLQLCLAVALGKKTEFFEDEKVFLVTSLNCNGAPYESMMQVREHFGDRTRHPHRLQSRRDHRLRSAHGALIYSSKAHLCRPDQRKVYLTQKRTRGISRRRLRLRDRP